jgi:hypothetical protein
MANFPIKWLNNNMTGAPQLTAAWGSLTTMLDAVLVNGFNSRSVSSITRTGSVATVTFATAHGFIVDQIVNITGADQTEYNGDQLVTSLTNLTISFNVAGSPTTPATGTINCKTPGLQTSHTGFGFEIYRTGTNKRVYRTTNTASNRACLRVDNALDASGNYPTTYAKSGRVTIAQDYTDVDTVSGVQAPFNPAFPTRNTTVSSGVNGTAVNGWFKWYHSRFYNTANAQSASTTGMESSVAGTLPAGVETTGNRSWVVVGDDRGFYLFIDTAGPANIWGNAYGRTMYAFTDYKSKTPGDLFNTALVATEWFATAATVAANAHPETANFMTASGNAQGKVVLNHWSGLGGYRTFSITSVFNLAASGCPGLATGVVAINPSDNSLLLFPTYMISDSAIIGTLPGLYWPVGNRLDNMDLSVVDGVVNYPSKKFLTVGLGRGSDLANTNNARYSFDITGPWW